MSSTLAKVPEGRRRLAGDEIIGAYGDNSSRPEGTPDGTISSGAPAGAREFVGTRFRRLHRRLISVAPPALLRVFVRLLPALGSVFIASLAPLHTQATDFGDIVVQVAAITDSGEGAHYDEYRATITNGAPAKSHQVTLILGREFDRFIGHGIREIRRSVEVAPTATVNVSLFAPPLAPESGEIVVVIDGQRQREAVIIDSARTSAWTRHALDKAELLVSADVGKSGLMNHEAVLTGFNSAVSGASEVAYLSYNAPLAEWSEHWLAYAQFNGVLVTADELRGAPEAVRATLLRYVECGGVLIVFGAWPVPAQWQARRQFLRDNAAPDGAPINASAPAVPNVPRYLVGFGTLIVTGAVAPQQLTAEHWQALNRDWQGARMERVDHYDLAAINRVFPVVARVGIPVRGLFVLMLLFVIVIGPVNLLWLARRGRKIWMLWTVPLLSLLTCLAVAGFAVFSEGLSATARAESFTILDETAHRATTIGWTAFYAPVTPSDGLHFSYDTELLPQLIHYRGYGRSDRVLDWTNDQHLVTNWLTARVPAYFKLRKSELRRERLNLRQEAGGARRIVNGLGAEIERLWWVDGDGKIHTATAIAAGAAANLEPMTLLAAGEAGDLRAILNTGWLAQWQLIEQNPEHWLMPNCYLAVLSASPFVEEGLKDVQTRRARALVYGIHADAATATVPRP